MIHCIFDTETTDLIYNSLQPIHKQPRIFEIFALKLDGDFNEVGTFHRYLDPATPLAKKASEATGMTLEMLKGKPSFREIADDWKEFLNGTDIVVAHNIKFDSQMVNFEYQRIGEEIIWPKLFCTVEKTEHLKGHRLSLTDLHVLLFGEGFEKAHSAENDVRATARCYVELIQKGEI